MVEAISGMTRTYTFVFDPDPEGGFRGHLPRRPQEQRLQSCDTVGRHCHIEQVEALIDRGEARLRHWNRVAWLSPGRQ